MKQEEKGVVSIEAVLSLTIFLFAFLVVLGVTNLIRAQVSIQVGLNQAAKELSQYGYILAKAGLIEADQVNQQEAQKFKENTDEVIGNLVSFISSVQTGAEDLANTANKTVDSVYSGDVLSVANGLKDAAGTYDEIYTAGQSLKNAVSNYASNPQELLAGMLAVFKSEASSLVKSRLIAAPLGRALVGKYLSGMTGNPDSYLKQLGVVNGLDGLNFDASTLFDDGSTINLTVIYQTEIKFPIFKPVRFVTKLNASTAIWGSKIKSTGLVSSSNIWELAPVTRGKTLTKIIKEENKTMEVKSGKNIDLYQKNKNKFINIYSLDPREESYQTSEGTYNETVIKDKMRFYANQLKENAEDIQKVTMQDGNEYTVSSGGKRNYEIYLAVPDSEQTQKSVWNKLAAEIEKETGVAVSITYRK